jgi:predicted alpha/beta-fold hydrolase
MKTIEDEYMKEQIRKLIRSLEADVCGFAHIERFDNAPTGYNMKRTVKVMGTIILVFIGSLCACLLIVWINSPGKLTPLKDTEGKIIQGFVSEKVWIEINGIKQGMFIRGENPQNPVILYLHGGPGTPLLQFIEYLEKSERLEKYFTVCYWDQRGAGMTYSKSTDISTMTAEQMVEDTREVTKYLKSRFGQDKIYLFGHSWDHTLALKQSKNILKTILRILALAKYQILRNRNAYPMIIC